MERFSTNRIRKYWGIGLIAFLCLIIDTTSQARLKGSDTNAHLPRNPATGRPLGSVERGKITAFNEIEPDGKGPEVNECFWGQKPTLVIVASNPNDASSFVNQFENGQAIVFPVTPNAINTRERETSRKNLTEMKRKIHGITVKIADPRQFSHPTIQALRAGNPTFWVGILSNDGRVQEYHRPADYRQQLESARQSDPVLNRCPASTK